MSLRVWFSLLIINLALLQFGCKKRADDSTLRDLDPPVPVSLKFFKEEPFAAGTNTPYRIEGILGDRLQSSLGSAGGNRIWFRWIGSVFDGSKNWGFPPLSLARREEKVHLPFLLAAYIAGTDGKIDVLPANQALVLRVQSYVSGSTREFLVCEVKTNELPFSLDDYAKLPTCTPNGQDSSVQGPQRSAVGLFDRSGTQLLDFCPENLSSSIPLWFQNMCTLHLHDPSAVPTISYP